MNFLIELLKAAHFLCILLFFVAFSYWVKEEFFLVFIKKKPKNLFSLKTYALRLLSNNPTFNLINGGSKGYINFLYIGAILFGTSPLFFVQFTDKFDLFGYEIFFGLISSDQSWLYFVAFCSLGEIFRTFLEPSYKTGLLKITLLFGLLLTFLNENLGFSIEHMIQYQKSFSEDGIRNYLLFKNNIGLILIFIIIFLEIENPKKQLGLISHLYLTVYSILFIFAFLGGFGLPSILEDSNIKPSLNTIFLQNISIIIKFIFITIIIWALKFTIIKARRKSYVSV